jgi:hypothetical protein
LPTLSRPVDKVRFRGYGISDASAIVQGYQVPSNLSKYIGGTLNIAFGQPVTFDLPIDVQYPVLLAATAYVYSAFDLEKESSGRRQASILLSLSTRQPSTQHAPRKRTFSLSDYYSQFSPNVNLNPSN